MRKSVPLSVHVPPGCSDRARFVFRNSADEVPGMEAGDVIVEVHEKPHPLFVRLNDSDLLLSQTVSLVDALSGVRFVVPQLDGTSLEIACPEGAVISPGDVNVVHGRGMPRRESPDSKGDLFVRFQVSFPNASSLPARGAALREQLRPLMTEDVSAQHDSSTGVGGRNGDRGNVSSASHSATASSVPVNRRLEVEDVLAAREQATREARQRRSQASGAECQQM